MDNINATKRTDIYQVDPRNVVVVENFNVRRDFDIEELKEQIKAKGVLNPITVIPFKDENGVEKYRLVMVSADYVQRWQLLRMVRRLHALRLYISTEQPKRRIC